MCAASRQETGFRWWRHSSMTNVKIWPDFGTMEQSPILWFMDRWAPLAAFLMYEFWLVTCFLYQYRAMLFYKNGQEDWFAWVIISGLLGMFAAIAPMVFCVCEGFGQKIVRIWSDWMPCWSPLYSSIITFVIHFGLFIGFIVVMAMMGPSSAELARVDTRLHFEPSCLSSRLVLVEEMLSFDLPDGHASLAERALPNQVEPEILGIDHFNNVSGIWWEVKRRDPQMWELDYETGQLTTLKFQFDRRFHAFQLRLRYRARLHGSGATCEDGGAVCSAGTPGWSRVSGWWDANVPGDVVQKSLEVAGCADANACGGPQGNWTFSAERDGAESARWRVMLQVPQSLAVGGTNCPLAWEIEARNAFWIVGAVLLAGAVGCCCLGMQGASGGDGTVLLVVAAVSGCLALTACIFFGVAMFWDSRT